jgi:D-amino-acid oxidase
MENNFKNGIIFMTRNIAVIGAGIIGLTSAIRLLEKGFSVTVFAREIDTMMASRAAPAYWNPFKAAPEESIIKWARKTYEIYQDYPANHGIHEIESRELFLKDTGLPLWSKIIKEHTVLSASEIPTPYVKAYEIKTFLSDTTVVIDDLQEQVRKLGGKIFQKEFKKITDVDAEFKTIINCSGVWSNQLVPDTATFPIRGQFISLQKPQGLNKIIFGQIDDNGYALVVPRKNDCWIGGTTVNHDWSLEVDAAMTKTMLERATVLEPRIEGMKILKTSVGLRPGRKEVRLEAEETSGRLIIHNYGHGGSGFTVGWGCAEEVVSLCEA